MEKLKKISESYLWVHEIENKSIVELKKTTELLEEIHNRFFSKFGISNTKFNVLVILYKGDESGMILSEIGERMLVTKGNITGLIDRLEKQGYVRRIRDKEDRRKVLAAITERGKAYIEEVMEAYKNWSKEMLHGVDVEEINKMVEILEKMRMNLIKNAEQKGGF
ncbi:MarR family winged helix-turn-helix transcriptional regulator [Geosporobacter ferrireducens]|uniref:MarR family winged helix-turn-helix transcriptional regulator n=1 Tax=Geosporobacter ferrireducens TaxID=1424294 RepID=UPI000B124CE6|nr:MarR family transcriptional regulator [Geosporobacter ferrireducens]